MPRHLTAIAAFAVVLLPLPASAQNVGPAGAALPAGTRIRATLATSFHPVVGEVIALRADTLVMRSESTGDTIAVPVGQVFRLEVSEGTRTFRRQGAKIGLVTGLAIGAIVGVVSHRDAGCGGEGAMLCIDLGPGVDMTFGAVIGGAAGALVGALLGSYPIEVWKRTDSLDGRQRLGIAPSPRGGIVLTTSFAF